MLLGFFSDMMWFLRRDVSRHRIVSGTKVEKVEPRSVKGKLDPCMHLKLIIRETLTNYRKRTWQKSWIDS